VDLLCWASVAAVDLVVFADVGCKWTCDYTNAWFFLNLLYDSLMSGYTASTIASPENLL